MKVKGLDGKLYEFDDKTPKTAIRDWYLRTWPDKAVDSRGTVDVFTDAVARGSGNAASMVTDVIPQMIANAMGDTAESEEEGIQRMMKLRELETLYPRYHDRGGIGDIIPWAAEAIGENVPMLGTSLGGGIIGGLTGGPGGAVAGATIGSGLFNIPESYEASIGAVGRPLQGPEWGAALAAGGFKTALDAVPVMRLLRKTVPGLAGQIEQSLTNKVIEKTLGRQAAGSWPARVISEGFGQAAYEGVTEAGQELADITAEKILSGNTNFTSEDVSRLIEAGKVGAVVGGPLGGIAGVLEGSKVAPIVNPAQPLLDQHARLEGALDNQRVAEAGISMLNNELDQRWQSPFKNDIKELAQQNKDLVDNLWSIKELTMGESMIQQDQAKPLPTPPQPFSLVDPTAAGQFINGTPNEYPFVPFSGGTNDGVEISDRGVKKSKQDRFRKQLKGDPLKQAGAFGEKTLGRQTTPEGSEATVGASNVDLEAFQKASEDLGNWEIPALNLGETSFDNTQPETGLKPVHLGAKFDLGGKQVGKTVAGPLKMKKEGPKGKLLKTKFDVKGDDNTLHIPESRIQFQGATPLPSLEALGIPVSKPDASDKTQQGNQLPVNETKSKEADKPKIDRTVIPGTESQLSEKEGTVLPGKSDFLIPRNPEVSDLRPRLEDGKPSQKKLRDLSPEEIQQHTEKLEKVRKSATKEIDTIVGELKKYGDVGEKAHKEISALLQRKDLSPKKLANAFTAAAVFTNLPKSTKVGLRFEDSLKRFLGSKGAEDSGKGNLIPAAFINDSDVEQTIRWALDHDSDAKSYQAHEAFHVFQNYISKYDPRSWNILKDTFGAPGEKISKDKIPASVKRVLGNISIDGKPAIERINEQADSGTLISHELMAYTYQAWQDGQGGALPGGVKSFMGGVGKLGAKLKSFFNGNGFKNAEDVFESIYSGKAKSTFNDKETPKFRQSKSDLEAAPKEEQAELSKDSTDKYFPEKGGNPALEGVRQILKANDNEKRKPTKPELVVDNDDAQLSIASWRPGRVDHLLREYAYPNDPNKTKAYAAFITPDQFLNLTATREDRRIIDEESDFYREDVDRIKINDQTPFLRILFPSKSKAVANVVGHEGRHRFTAMRDFGHVEIPVIIDVREGMTLDPQDMMMLNGQGFQRDETETVRTLIPVSYKYENELKERFANKDFQFSIKSVVKNKAADLMGKIFPEQARLNFRIALIDKFAPISDLVDEVKKNGMTLDDMTDVYNAESVYHGRVGARADESKEKLYTPALKFMKEHNITPQEMSDYLLAEHAEERRAWFKGRNPKMEESEFADTYGPGVTKEWVAEIKAKYNSDKRPFADAARKFYDIIDDTNRIREESGLQLIEEEEKTPFKKYVPLWGDEVDPTGEYTEKAVRTGKGFSIKGKEDKKAYGRTGKPNNIVENVIMQHDTTIIRSEKNRVANAFLNFVNEFGDKFTVTDRHGNEVPMFKVNPVDVVPFESASGMISYRPSMQFNDPTKYIHIKRNGKVHVVEVEHGRTEIGKKIAMALNNQFTSNAMSSGFFETLAKVGRYFSLINTAWNPDYWITNYTRDLQTAGVNALQYLDKNEIPKLIKNSAVAANAIRNWYNGKKDGVWAQAYDELRLAGGTTAYLGLRDLDHHRTNINELLNDIKPDSTRAHIKHTFNKIKDKVETINNIMENANRLSIYKTLRDKGVSKDRAAGIAKNITINFNRRGQYGPVLNAMYIFYNASVQGSLVMYRALKNPKVRKAAAGIVISNFLLDLMNASLSGDEDKDGINDYDMMPQWKKDTSTVFIIPGVEPITIPMPYGYNVFSVLGRSMGEVVRGVRTPGEAAGQVLSATMDAFNPIGGAKNILNILSPTASDVIVDLKQNKDFTGRNIMPEASPFGPDKPASARYWSSTQEPWVTMAGGLHTLTGGTAARPGGIEVSPNELEYIYGWLTGGAGRFVQRAGDLAMKLGKGDYDSAAEDLVPDVPFIRRLTYSPGQRDRQNYYSEALDDILLTKEGLKTARKEGDQSEILRIKEEEGDQLKIMGRFLGIDKRIDNLRDSIKKFRANDKMDPAIKEKRIDALDKQIKELMNRANKMYKENVD